MYVSAWKCKQAVVFLSPGQIQLVAARLALVAVKCT